MEEDIKLDFKLLLTPVFDGVDVEYAVLRFINLMLVFIVSYSYTRKSTFFMGEKGEFKKVNLYVIVSFSRLYRIDNKILRFCLSLLHTYDYVYENNWIVYKNKNSLSLKNWTYW